MTQRRARQVAAAILWCLVAGLSLRPAGAAEASGEVQIVGAETGRLLSGGGSDTPFTLRLPDGAACPGDSQEGQYRVQSFLVPQAVDPGSLEYKGLRPQAAGGWALYGVDTTTYVNKATAKAASPGGEGTIINEPSLSFAVFKPGMVAPGRYRMGVACSLFAATERFWETQIDVVADDGEPSGFSWRVISAAATPPRSAGQGNSMLGVAVAGAGMVAAVVLVMARRRSRTPTPAGRR